MTGTIVETLHEPVLLEKCIVYQYRVGAFQAEAKAQTVLDVWEAEGRAETQRGLWQSRRLYTARS